MKLSAPVFILKQQAKALSRTEKIPLHQALNRIANEEGFGAWSLLSARLKSEKPVAALLAQLYPGNLVLLAARPGQGKTLLGQLIHLWWSTTYSYWIKSGKILIFRIKCGSSDN